MRKALATLVTGLSLGALAATPALADVSTTQTLPVQACNAGTMNAHENIPETTGTGTTTPAHMAVPRNRQRYALRPRWLTERRSRSQPRRRRAIEAAPTRRPGPCQGGRRKPTSASTAAGDGRRRTPSPLTTSPAGASGASYARPSGLTGGASRAPAAKTGLSGKPYQPTGENSSRGVDMHLSGASEAGFS